MSSKKIFREWKVWLLIVCFILAVVAIHPDPWADGVAIRSVIQNSAAASAGISNPQPTTPPMSREVIYSINNIPVHNTNDYDSIIGSLAPNITIIIQTSKNTYRLTTLPQYNTTVLNQTVFVNYTQEVFDNSTNKTFNVTSQRLENKTLQTLAGTADLGLRVYNAPTSNIHMGLDLQGGSRVILKPETPLSTDDMNNLVDNMKQRLNVYGLSDISVAPTTDLEGRQFIVVEIAGATDEEVRNLLASQGKFEGKIGNNTVFKGGQDIKYVCRTPDCSRITQCNQASGGYVCQFNFAITLSPAAADRQAVLTQNLSTVVQSGQSFLNETLDLYLDDINVSSLQISESLKGRSVTDISISGSGVGATQQDAINAAAQNMKQLQTILITGSLPVKLDVVDTSNISPALGSGFIQNTFLVGFLAMLFVVLAIMIRYRRFVVSVPVIITLISELVILLGFAAIIGWNIDLIAIAAIIIAIGTGVDDQIIIIDEISGKRGEQAGGWKDRIKNAFFIVMASYFTLVVAMIPLLSAGAGLLKGFAITTILGVSIGVFITRPAFAVIAEHLLRHETE